MKLSRSVIILILAFFLLWLFAQLPGAHAQGAVPQQPVVTPPPTPNPVDVANAEAARWQAVADHAVQSAQTSINQAYGALASAQAGLNQAQVAVQQEYAARIAAEAGQIQQAVTSAQAALIAANTATDLAKSANDAAVNSILQSNYAQRDVTQLQADLRQRDATIAGLTSANQTQQSRIAELEQYSWSKYRETIMAWVTAGLLGFVLISLICGSLIVFALERRNRWPVFKHGFKSAIIMPIDGQPINHPLEG
jgi:hypothetical protein